jgi:hypothetical protein
MLKGSEDMEDIFDDGIDAEEMALILGLADEISQAEKERLKKEKELFDEDDLQREDEDDY